MKIRTFVALFLALGMVFSASSYAVSGDCEESVKTETASSETLCEKALEARFLNMLNHNFAYNDDFTYDDLIDDSIVAVEIWNENSCITTDSGDTFVEKDAVLEFARALYGVTIGEEEIAAYYGKYDADFPSIDGYLYVLGRGYTLFQHEILSVQLNEDDSYTVKTKVYMSGDGENGWDTATALIVPNDESPFGFVIGSCDLDGDFVIGATQC